MLSMATNVKKQFAEWIEKAFLNWQADKGKRASLNEFAEYIGYSRPLISFWLAGQRLPTADGIKRLSELFGIEIYDILDLPRPDPDLTYLQSSELAWDSTSHPSQQDYSKVIQ